MELFSFDKKEVTRLLRSELKLHRRQKEAFNYVFDRLKAMGKYVSGDNITIPETSYDDSTEWLERKNYPWLAVESGDVKLLIRKYRQHFTIFQKFVEKHEDEKYGGWTDTKYGAFSFNTDTDLIDNDEDLLNHPDAKQYKYLGDFFCDSGEMHDLNKYINAIIEHTTKRMGSMWICEVEGEKKPKRILIKDIFDGDDCITDIEQMCFACEELSQVQMELFAEHDMLERLKDFKKGDMYKSAFQREPMEILEVRTKVKDGYYHDVGIKTEKRFYDIYYLAHYDFDFFFPKKDK